MTTFRQLSFAAGEISDDLAARVDTVKYSTGLRTLRNCIVQKFGTVQNRPSTAFVGEVKDSTKRVRLIPFVFNDDQKYMLEFGDLYIRVIKNGAYVSDLSLTITSITNASPAVLTYTGTDPANGDEVAISGVVGAMANYVNGRNFKIASVNTGANTFQLKYMDGTNVNSSAFGLYSSGGTAARIYTLTSTYVEADLQELNFDQSADVITLTHQLYPPADLARLSDSSWTLTDKTFAPAQVAPVVAALPAPFGSGYDQKYVVTAISTETSEESLPSNVGFLENTDLPTIAHPITVSWSGAAGAVRYNVYKQSPVITGQDFNGIYGFMVTVGLPQFTDDGTLSPDFSDNPPVARNPFPGASDYPATSAYFQQRQYFARTINNPETIWGSRVGFFNNFTINSPLQDDDAVTFTLTGKRVNAVQHLLDLSRLIIFTAGREIRADGDGTGLIKPGEINPKAASYNGSSTLFPIAVNETAIYLQAGSSIVRDLIFDVQIEGYRGNDLTLFSSHLVEDNTIVDWAYQQKPNSIIWAVRDDGVFLGLTYVREQEIIAWHRHDVDGLVENVASIPDGNEDTVYLAIKRTIDGVSKRYIEKFNTRKIGDIVDYVGMDCSLTYDGRNGDSTTMTLSGGTTWVYTETLTLTASASFFTAADVGNAIHLIGSDGTLIRFVITGYTSATVVSGKSSNITVPVAMRSVAITDWARAVDQLAGLWHLEGEAVSVFGDGFVVASPNNASYTQRTVENGVLSLDRPYGVIHVGLPIINDIETLNIDSYQGEPLADKKKQITKVNIHVKDSRGIWAGFEAPSDDEVAPLQGLNELKIRGNESMNDPVRLATEVVDITINNGWNSNGRVFIRQVDPVPLTVLAIMPAGLITGR